MAKGKIVSDVLEQGAAMGDLHHAPAAGVVTHAVGTMDGFALVIVKRRFSSFSGLRRKCPSLRCCL